MDTIGTMIAAVADASPPSPATLAATALSLVAAAVLICAPLAGKAVAADGFSDEQKKQIGEVVKDYLLKNPDLILEVQAALEAKREK